MNGHAVAEFPILYYVAALIKAAFGISYTSLRSIHLFFVLGGHVLLSYTAARWLGSVVAGTFFSLWMFSSSVVVYYAANYLPDAAAYGLVLGGLCMAISGIERNNSNQITTSIIFLTLAGLLKAPACLYLIAVTLTGILLPRVGRVSFSRANLILCGIGLVLCLCWHSFAILYNQAHHTHYFMTWAEPIWSMDLQSRRSTWQLVTDYWWTKYHHPTTWHVLLALLIGGAFLARRIPLHVRILLSFLMLAFLAYVMLFFRKFADHDYYFLTISPIIAFGSLAVLTAILRLRTSRWMGVGIASLMVLFSIMGMSLAMVNLERRYSAPDAFTVSTILEGTIGPVLRKHVILNTSKVVVIGDPTPDGALLFMNMKGWAYGPDERVPPLDSLESLGAEQVLVLGATTIDLSRLSTMDQQGGWRLFSFDHEAR